MALISQVPWVMPNACLNLSTEKYSVATVKTERTMLMMISFFCSPLFLKRKILMKGMTIDSTTISSKIRFSRIENTLTSPSAAAPVKTGTNRISAAQSAESNNQSD